jgi:hypothetical protein
MHHWLMKFKFKKKKKKKKSDLLVLFTWTVQAGGFPLILDVVVSNSSRNNNSEIRRKGVNCQQ